MKCPICSQDLSPLDLVSRTEHVDLCIEHGPAVVEIGESGQLVVKKTVPIGKKRLICPICDKTFMNLATHFKVCALKFDVPPQLMLEHWDQINSHSKNPKKFPRELLDSFVEKCIKEGRVGDQVDFARALSLSMADGSDDESQQSSDRARDGVRQRSDNTSVIPLTAPNISGSPQQQQQQVGESNETPSTTATANALAGARNVNQVLMRNATIGGQTRPRRKFRLELVNEEIKTSNIALRIERELAASRSKRYHETLAAARSLREQILDSGRPVEVASQDDDDCVMLIDMQYLGGADSGCNEDELNKLFHRARLKDCNGSEVCLEADCKDHELVLILEEFRVYSGSSMDAPPTRTCPPSGSSKVIEGVYPPTVAGKEVKQPDKEEEGDIGGVTCAEGGVVDDRGGGNNHDVRHTEGNKEVTARLMAGTQRQKKLQIT